MRAAAVLDAPSQPYENLFIRPGLENYSLATLPQTTTPGGFGAYLGVTPNAFTTQVVASNWAQSGRAFRATWSTRSNASGDIGLSINNTGNGIATTRWLDIVGQKVTAVWDVVTSDDTAYGGMTVVGATGGTVTQNAAVSGVGTFKAGVPTRVWVTFTIGAGVTTVNSIRANLQNLPLTAGVWAEISNAQLYLGDYVPGRALGTGTLSGWSWSGTAGSSSSRGYPYPQPMTGPQLRPGSQNGSITGLSTTVSLPDTWTASDFLLLFVNSNYTQTLTFPTRVDAFTQLATSGPAIAGGTGGSANPLYVSGSGAAGGNQGSVTVTAPATITAGNLLICIITNASGTPPNYLMPSGWALAGSVGILQNTSSAAVFTKIATATEPASYTINTQSSFCAATISQYSGVSGLDGTPVFLQLTSGTSYTSPTQPAGAGDGKVVAYCSYNGNTFTTPTGTVARVSARSLGNESIYTFDALTTPANTYTSTMSAGGAGVIVSMLLAPAAGASTPGDPNAGLLQAFRITPTPGSASVVVNATTSGILRWWCGAYTQVSLTAAVAAAANNLGNNTTAAIEVPSVTLPKVALGNELYVSVASVNSSATWGTPADVVFSNPSGNAVLSIRSGLIPAGVNSYASTPFDRGLEGTSRNESAMTLVLQAA